MRLHRLELTAFGPFGGHQEIDFDRLTETGLFLLHGPTGAGKTSVLDAVCFALYGKVPGARGQGARLRSDHAGETAVPTVVCEMTLAGRRFEVTRVAEWMRPKRRGTGLVKEQSRVVLRELVGGQWLAVSNRIDETADLLQRLIGLGPDQFTKLVLLPQGEFATFLRAKPDDRKPLLQKLFGTDRFEAVETWLVERRRELRREAEAAGVRTARLLARAEQAAAGVDEPVAGADRADLDANEGGEVDGGEVDVLDADAALAVLAGRLAVAAAAEAHFRARVAVADPAESAARKALELGARTARLQTRHAEVLRRLATLAEARPDQAHHRQRLAEAGAAALIAPSLAEQDEAAAQLERARRRAAAAGDEVNEVSGELFAAEGVDPQARLRELHAEHGRLAELVEVAALVEELDEQLGAASAAAAGARDQVELHRAVDADRVARREELRSAVQSAALLAGGLADRDQDVARAGLVARAVLARDGAQEILGAQETAVQEAFELYRGAAQTALDLRARRLDGMAAELAGTLADGAPCPVCGAAEHPVPAPPHGDQVTQADERVAAAARDAAEEALRKRERARDRTRQELAALRATAAGLDAGQAATALAEAAQRQAAVRQAETERLRFAAELDRLELQLTAGRSEAEQAADVARQADHRLTGLSASRVQLDRQLGGRTAGTVREQASRLAALTAAWHELAEARRALETAGERQAQGARTATSALAEAGFSDLAAARAALLPERELAILRADVEAHDQETAQLKAQLEDAELIAAADLPVVGLPALEAAAAQAREDRRVSAERHLLASRALTALTGLHGELADHLLATAPRRERFAVVDSLARSVEGTGDNQLRMRLSAYVLAARLEQVADAASHRLAAMTDGRYALRHSDGPVRGGGRSGLGLLVLDSWTGIERDPATLSGGETFCTSLALALGLADVVSAEAGGMQLETLLVDEGFGSLDDETLEQVLDVVDGLRSGGRAVGLVSHVADLRQRIPAQLEVIKTRTGSTLRQHAAP